MRAASKDEIGGGGLIKEVFETMPSINWIKDILDKMGKIS